MDQRWVPFQPNAKLDVKVFLYPTSEMEAVRNKTATDAFDLTPFLSAGTHTFTEANLTLSWNTELWGVHQPKPNQILEIQLYNNGIYQTIWLGIVESLTNFNLSRGERSLQLVARGRGSNDNWKTTKRVTELFPQMTDITYIIRKIALSAGLTDEEIWLPNGSISTSHSNTQLADMSASEMIEALMIPLGWTPFFDSLGRLRAATRQLSGAQGNIILKDEQVIRISASKARPPVTRVNLHWLDPILKKSKQQGRKLADATLTTGWFLPFIKKTIWFSQDKTQRAEKTYLVIKQSANNFFVRVVVSEKYKQTTQNEGEIKLINWAWGPTILFLVGAWTAAHNTPDLVDTATATTIPVGRRTEAKFQFALMMIMLSIGTGIYEVWGTPFDWVHARNTTVAFDENAPSWADNPTDIDSDFVMNEQHGQAIAVRELIYSARAANKWEARLVDNPQIEYGDILEFPDQTLLYVEDIQRTLTKGSTSELVVKGFLAGKQFVPQILPDTIAVAPGGSTGTTTGTTTGTGTTSGSGVPVVDDTSSGGTSGGAVQAPLSLPALPNATTGRTTTVSSGDDLQAAINAAEAGDTLVLDAGAVFTGNFTLPNKSGTAGITITTNATLPAANVRVDPTAAINFPLIQSGNSQTAMATLAGAHDYTFRGIKFGPNTGAFGDIITLGSGDVDQTSLSQVPQRILLDQCFIYGDPSIGQKRAIGLNSGNTTIKNCWIQDIFISGQDSQAIGGWNGPGPYYITNNYLEAASENIMFGGSDPHIANLIPADITVTKNHLTKKTAWRGAGYVIKNLFELKNGRRCLVRGNVMEYSWVDGQAGNIIVLTPRNQEGGAPWCTVEDVNVEYNLLRHGGGAFDLTGHDFDFSNPVIASRIRIANNLAYDIDSSNWGGNGSLYTMVDGPIDALVWDHNTFIQSDNITNIDGCQLTNYVVTNNLLVEGTYGWFTSGMGSGKNSLDSAAPGYVWASNVVGGAGSVIYPSGTLKPDMATFDANFTDPANGDYSLVDTSTFKHGGSDGKDLGCDIAGLLSEIAGVL